MPKARTTPKPIAVSQTIGAPPSAVWALISAPGYLERCHPFCATNRTHVWPGPGSRDTLEYHNGRVVERRFIAWTENESYDIEVSDSEGLLASVQWRLAPVDGGTRLTIDLTPHRFDRLPSILRRPCYGTVVRPMMRRYLRSVVLGVEYAATTSKAVRRNQFGSHSWFSR